MFGYRLHPEGYTTITACTLLLGGLIGIFTWLLWGTAVFWIVYALAGLTAVVLGFLFNFFRNPKRQYVLNEQHILAPCDGKVVLIQQVEDRRYFNGPVKQVSIFMSPLNVHCNRNPISGTVKKVEYRPGSYLVAWHPKSSEKNEHTYVVTEAPSGLAVAVKQIAGAVARRIRYYVTEGAQVQQAKQFGFIKFGSRCDVLMPLDCEVLVEVGQKARAGQTVIAKAPTAHAAQ